MDLDEEIRRLADSPYSSLLARALESAPIAASIGVDGKIVYGNPACSRMWGYDHASEVLGFSYFDLIAPDDREELVRIWRSRMPDSTEPWTYRLRGLRRDGSLFPFACVSMPLALNGLHAVMVYFYDLSGMTEDQAARLERSLLQNATPPPTFVDE